MARLVAPDKGLKITDVNSRSYRPNRQGIYEVGNARDAAAMKREGFFEAALNPYSKADETKGYNCVECGFGSWFKKCGRCGYENQRTERDGE